MATLRYFLTSSHFKKNGTCNVKIEISQKGERKYIATPFFVTKADLSADLSKIKNKVIRAKCEDMVTRLRGQLDLAGLAADKWSAGKIYRYLVDGDEGDDFHLDFIGFGREYAAKIAAKHSGQSGNVRSALNSFEKYVGGEIDINDITAGKLNAYVATLGEKRAPSLYISCLRVVFDNAKSIYNDEDRGIVKIPYSPFSRVVLPKCKEPEKRAITANQILSMWALDSIDGSRAGFARDVFLLSFLGIGINSVDLYRLPSHGLTDKFTYYRAKTKDRRKDNALISIKIEPEAIPLIGKYRAIRGDLAFDFAQRYADRGTFSAALNKGLKIVGHIIGADGLQFYAARHTWATIARNDCGIEKSTIHEALNHSDESMRVTDLYIKRDWNNIAKANRLVIDKIFYRKLRIKRAKEIAKQRG